MRPVSRPGASPDTAPTEVRAPFGGMVTLLVDEGDQVAADEVLAVLEAMKMEAPVTAPRRGSVLRVCVEAPAVVAGGDLLLVLT